MTKHAHKPEAQAEKTIDPRDQKIAQLEDQLKRTLADLENFRRRAAEERIALLQNGNTETIRTVLPTLNNFERAFQTLPKNADPVWTESFTKIYQGLLSSLQTLGLKKMETIGQPFDANFHDALGTVPGEKDIIITELEPGYLLNDTILRHAKVQIGNGEKA